MKLKNLMLSNFRGFEQIEIDFCDDVTVIAGINGSGKSSLLMAISSIASYLLPKVTLAKKETFSLTSTDIYSKKTTLSISTNFSRGNQVLSAQILRSNSNDINVAKLTEERNKLRKDKIYMEKGSTEDIAREGRLYSIQQLLKESVDIFSFQSEKYEGAIVNPLIIYYSTNRSFSRLPPRLSGAKPLTPGNAYTNSLRQIEISLNDFSNWYRALKIGSIGGTEFSTRLLEKLESVIEKMLPGFSNLVLVDTPKPHFTIEKENKQFELEQLSEGERGILALAFDLTRRLTLANPQSQNAIEEGVAIVMIDEIELHLHPTWQRQVLRRLTSTFKNCQFIVTTHSPQVIGQTRAEKLRLLYTGDKGKIRAITPNQALGMDSSWILQNIMGSSARDYETEQKLSAIFDAIDNDDYPSARQGITQLLEAVGNFPDLQEASSLLDRLELLEKYEED